MSNYVLPSLPGLSVNPSRAPEYATTELVAVSGKALRFAARVSPIVTYRLKFNFLRGTVNAPNESGSGGQDWSGYTELALLKYWHQVHKGKLDSWLLRDPDGGAQVRVHFTSDVLTLAQIVPNVWEGEIEVESVL